MTSDDYGRCENCGQYVDEHGLAKVVLDYGQEQLWCQDCLHNDGEGIVQGG